MRRRLFIATTGTIGTGSITGCLGSLLGENAASCGHKTLPGRTQWRYDACNSGYAAGITAPTEQPTLQRIYRGSGATPLTTNDAIFTETWSAEIGGNTRWQLGESKTADRGAALYEDTVLGIGDPFDGFWAASMTDGSERWRTDLSPGPVGTLRPVGPLTIQADRAYYATMIGVGCVDLAAQEEAWAADLNAEFSYLLKSTQWQPPAATSSHVFALTSFLGGERDWDDYPRQLFALDQKTGDIDWTVDFAPGEKAIQQGPIVGGGRIFVTATVEGNPERAFDRDVRVIAVDPAAREVVWRKTFPVQNVAVPAIANGRLYVSHGQGEEVPPELVALDPADGSVAWRAEHDSPLFVPTVTEETIVACDGIRLRAFDPETGDTSWEFDFLDQVTAQTDLESGFDWTHQFIPVVHDGRIFVYLGVDWFVEFQ